MLRRRGENGDKGNRGKIIRPPRPRKDGQGSGQWAMGNGDRRLSAGHQREWRGM